MTIYHERAMLRALTQINGRPFTVTEAATVLRIPGKTPGARAQRLRRMERAGVLPKARRSRVHDDRVYTVDELVGLP